MESKSPQEKAEELTAHAKRQADLWRQCVDLNRIYPIGSEFPHAGKITKVESPFSVVANNVTVTLDGKQIKIT